MAAKKSSTVANKPKRRSPISRQEGQQRLVNAAMELMYERPFSEIGVRDIATRADVNHGFVHVWFGSKNLLFIAVRNQIIENIAEKLRHDPLDALGERIQGDPEAILLARLTAWLELEGAEGIETQANGPLIEAVTQRYVAVGLTPKDARVAAMAVVALGVTGIVAGKTLDTAHNIPDIIALWQRMVGLLAADSRA
jgi:AcrR family transcriptional regulator